MIFSNIVVKLLGMIVFISAIIGAQAEARPKREDLFCNGQRITPTNYTFHYRKLRRQLRNWTQAGVYPDMLTAAANAGRSSWSNYPESELCRWNRFIFVDFVLYFQQLEDLTQIKPVHNARVSDEFKLRVLTIRDQLYSEWLDTLKYGRQTGFAEWESAGHQVKGESLNDFLSRGSEHFRSVAGVSRAFAGKPRTKTQSQEKEAHLVAHNLLKGRSPFSAILPEVAFSLLAKPMIPIEVRCIRDQLSTFSCSKDNLYKVALECTQNQPKRALGILGVLASQRMYLLRDFKTWMERNLKPRTFQRQFTALKEASEIYFMTETIGQRCGHESLYPEGYQAQTQSVKSYHFWSVAKLAHLLSEYGFDKENVIKAATKPARKYKRTIRLPGLAYNIVLAKPLNNSTVGDYKPVLLEQKLGADFGYNVYE